ncbi:MAG: 4Fe-4S dicluster domain-containing protein [Acidobacteriia bacterium]|nr:4Fe-4S dicluster domain-containing protein [Terriglobia bacterium]
MSISRRGFLQGTGGALIASLAIAEGTKAEGTKAEGLHQILPARSIAPTNQKWVMVIDLAKCDGCGDCTKACNAMHFVPSMQEWIRVYEVLDNPQAGPYYMARPCMHCDNPPCVRGCPVGATFKRTDGLVMMDQDRCIGCRNCIAQCPYGARAFNWSEPPHTPAELAHTYSLEEGWPHRKGVVEKCDFCPEMLRSGKLTACAENCSMGAVYVGDEYEDAVTNSKGETIQFSKVTKEGAGFRLLEELGTFPRVYYLPPAHRKYAAPGEAKS